MNKPNVIACLLWLLASAVRTTDAIDSQLRSSNLGKDKEGSANALSKSENGDTSDALLRPSGGLRKRIKDEAFGTDDRFLPAKTPEQSDRDLKRSKSRKSPSRPSPAPLPEPSSPSDDEDECNPDDSFIIFSGHNEAFSLETGFINITWAPAFVGNEKEGGSLLWCGQYTYHIFTSKDEDEETFFARVADRTVPELIQMANEDPDDDFFLDSTTDLSFEWDHFTPGTNYTILVTANIDRLGLHSDNREPARLEVATVDPKVKEGIEKVVAVPSEEDGGFSTTVLEDGAIILFYGDSLPEELDEIDTGVHFYADAVTTNGSPGLFVCADKLDASSLSLPVGHPSLAKMEAVACLVRQGDMGDIFDELDANGDLFDSTADLDDEELTDGESAKLEEELITLNENTLANLCIGAFPDSEDALADCLDEPVGRRHLEHGSGGDRRLFGRRFRSRARKFFRRVRQALDRRISLSKTMTFVNLDEGAKMVCESESGNRATEIGVGFDLSAHARFKIEVKLLSGFQSASVNLFGGFGVKGYALLTATLEKRLQPKPKSLVERNNRRTFFVGPVPIIINIRPNLSVFVEAALVVEADFLVAAQFGYDYDFGFSIVKGQGFKKTSKFTRRPIFDDDPVFDLRLNAAAEMGFTFALDVVLFGLLQGTLAADLGLGAEIEVGTNAEALAITRPFFYTLNKFELDAFIRIRAFVGLNSALTDVVRKVEDLTDGGKDAFECVISRGPYEVPEVPDRDASETPDALEQALEVLEAAEAADSADDSAVDSAELTDDDLNELLRNFGDDYSPDRGALEGQSLDFGANFVIFERDFFLLGIPNIDTVSGGVQTCQGDDAIILTVDTELDKAIIPLLDGLKDGRWFGDFDGSVLSENTAWRLDEGRDNAQSVTMRLPRSAIATQDRYEIPPESSVILRATPEILPFPPKSMFAKASLADIFSADVAPFECCDDSDCVVKLGEAGPGESRFCSINGECRIRRLNLRKR